MTSDPGHVEELYTAPSKGAPMVSHDAIDINNGGIVGDRYREGTGYYSATDGCAVTLVDAAVLDEARETFGLDLSGGIHRRNIVVRGVDLTSLLDATFELGEATLRGTKLRPPCAHLADLVGDDSVGDALRERRGGICADVVAPGHVAVGDTLRVTQANPREMGRQIAARLGADSSFGKGTDAMTHGDIDGTDHGDTE
ncbi:MOSC domain-containing protein [Haloferax sp. S1W]|uniref:MOSC domain-containing protein n=1 Tax=Haloferax sp. S1W TaxID=3377110 RepID=UPI0037C6A796